MTKNWNELGFDSPYELELHTRVQALESKLAEAAERIRELGQNAPELSRIAYAESLRLIEDALK